MSLKFVVNVSELIYKISFEIRKLSIFDKILNYYPTIFSIKNFQIINMFSYVIQFKFSRKKTKNNNHFLMH